MIDGWQHREFRRTSIKRPIPIGKNSFLKDHEGNLVTISTNEIDNFINDDNIEILNVYQKYKKWGDPWNIGWMNWPKPFEDLVLLCDQINWDKET